MLVIAGMATGLAGETARLDGGRGWHPIVAAAGILIAAGMSCGAALATAVAAWRLSIQWRLRSPHVQATMTASRPDDAAPGDAAPGDAARGDAAQGAAGTGQPRPAARRAYPLARGGTGAAAVAQPPAQQKMTQIKDLYREVEQMGDAEVNAHWEELRQRQHELIRQYFEQAKLGGADAGHAAN
jgi:hypothetical protein